MMRALKWLLDEIFGYAGDHGWVSVWMDNIVTLTDGKKSAGYLMMRTQKGKTEYRHMDDKEELEARGSDGDL
jgi:hypothetical protein